MEEFDLSNKIWSVQKFEKINWKKREKILFTSSVKEFIGQIKEDIIKLWEIENKEGNTDLISYFKVEDIIDKRAGGKLI